MHMSTEPFAKDIYLSKKVIAHLDCVLILYYKNVSELWIQCVRFGIV